jgi:biotin operon repressor
MSHGLERSLTLLSLLQTARRWPGSELAERLGVSPRTLRRDVEQLRSLGYPVEATMGSIGGYRLVAGTAVPPLLLDDEEAVAIAIGAHLAAASAIDGMEDASLRAIGKLEQVLPARLRRRVHTIRAATAPLLESDGATVDPTHLVVLSTAIADRNWVRSSSGCATDDCGRTSATSRPSTMLSPPSTRPSDATGRRSSAFARKDSGTASGPALLVDQRQPRGQVGKLVSKDVIGLVPYLGGQRAQPAAG